MFFDSCNSHARQGFHQSSFELLFDFDSAVARRHRVRGAQAPNLALYNRLGGLRLNRVGRV